MTASDEALGFGLGVLGSLAVISLRRPGTNAPLTQFLTRDGSGARKRFSAVRFETLAEPRAEGAGLREDESQPRRARKERGFDRPSSTDGILGRLVGKETDPAKDVVER